MSYNKVTVTFQRCYKK